MILIDLNNRINTKPRMVKDPINWESYKLNPISKDDSKIHVNTFE